MKSPFFQVLGTSTENSNNSNDFISNNNNNNLEKTDIIIERSHLQNKRASKKTHRNVTNMISLLPFYDSVQSNSLGTIKKDTELTNLNHLPLSTSSPIELASKCVTAQIEKDNSTPTLYEILSMYAIDNYNFNPIPNSSSFTRFEKVNYFGIPDKLLDDNNDSLVTNMGIFPEIKRAWLSVDNKLYIWNYNSSLTNQEFDVIDDFSGTILTCSLVKPKLNVFVESVNYLLIVSNSKDIKLLTLEFDNSNNKLIVSDPQMSVSTNGLIVNKITYLKGSNDIFFCGVGSRDTLWKLSYTNSNGWFSKSVTKECLTTFSNSSNLPNISVLNWINNDKHDSNILSVIDLKIDQTRNILYTLSSNSVIKCYRLQNKNGNTIIGETTIKRISTLLKELSTTVINLNSPLLNPSNLKIVNIHPITKNENPNLYLIAVASNGCRFYINGSTSYANRLTLTTNFVKFPPIDMKLYETIEKRKEKNLNKYQTFNDDSQYWKKSQSSTSSNNITTANNNNNNNNQGVQGLLFNSQSNDNNNNKQSVNTDKSITKSVANQLVSIEELKATQEHSKLLSHTFNTLIISPGIFIGFNKSLGLYTSTPDYGIFKKSSRYIEDFEVIDNFSNIYDIIQLTPSFNATNEPKGFANEFASQYTAQPLEFAVLTDIGIVIYRYKTPDLILEDSLNEKMFKQFGSKYGFDEACSTSLYLACKYDKSDSFRTIATKFFISGGQSSKLDKSLSAIIDNVQPSDRFLAVLILLSRLVREIWNKEVFKLREEIKFDNMGYISSKSIKSIKTDKQLILSGLNINKKDLEYLLCSILIIIKFFEENRNIIPGLTKDLSNQNETTSYQEKVNEICIQAERICFDSLSKFLNIIKEGLSFLTILLEEDDNKDPLKNFRSIISFLPIQMQADLSCITFSDFFAKSDSEVSKLIKELLSCIINKSISQGNSVELVANTLQEKCGYFCSTDDVLIFKAVESLKKAKTYSEEKNEELKSKFLDNSLALLKQSGDSLTEEIISDCVNIVLELGYYPNAIKFLLDIANTPEQIKLSTQYQNDLQLSMDVDPIKKNSYIRRLKLYHIIFQILLDIDKKALTSLEHDSTLIGSQVNDAPNFKSDPSTFIDKNGQLVTYFSQIRDECYKICLNYKDKMFHFEFYKWFVKNEVGEKLLYVDTPYILEFLEKNSQSDLEMSKLLWIYYSKKGDYYEAANQLYCLALSKFNISLVDRIQFLSIANNFIQGIETQYLKQDMMSLSSKISDLISVSNLQDELLLTIIQDDRINEMSERIAKEKLNNEILTINELYNEYIDPLGYYELALICFKLADYRNHEIVLGKWESLFKKWYSEYKHKPKSETKLFLSDLTNKFIIIAERVKDIDTLFPIMDLLAIMFKSIYTSLDGKQKVEPGIIINSFIKSGVSYSKLYYNLRNLIESTTHELFDGYSAALKSEMVYLLHDWFKNDKSIREVISPNAIRNLNDYDLNNDPIESYIRLSGNPL